MLWLDAQTSWSLEISLEGVLNGHRLVWSTITRWTTLLTPNIGLLIPSRLEKSPLSHLRSNRSRRHGILRSVFRQQAVTRQEHRRPTHNGVFTDVTQKSQPSIFPTTFVASDEDDESDKGDGNHSEDNHSKDDGMSGLRYITRRLGLQALR